jgi:uncharacterized membrane protein
VVILLALAVPSNPLNMLTRLAVGTAGTEQWLVLGAVTVIVTALGYLMQKYAETIAQNHQSG